MERSAAVESAPHLSFSPALEARGEDSTPTFVSDREEIVVKSLKSIL